MIHEHCSHCINIFCSKSDCPVISCEVGCYAKFHECKKLEHTLLCPLELVPCINAGNGCELMMPRYKLGSHLIDCPAYVLLCCFQWVRKMFDNSNLYHSHFCKKPKDVSNQLDLALTFYDQKRGKKKLCDYLGKFGTAACQSVEVGKDHFSYSYQYNPAHPQPGGLRWYRTSCNKKKHQLRPPFMTPLPSFLRNSTPYRAPLNLVKPITLVANRLPCKDKVLILEKELPLEEEPQQCTFGITHKEHEECTRVETSFSCYNVIALNNLPYLHRTEASLHLSCGQLLRRNQIQSHTQTVHNHIMAGIMDGWMIERCPLAVYGCPFYQIRVQPKGGKHKVMFDEELGVFYLKLKDDEIIYPNKNTILPTLPNEIWCLIGQYCDTYTLSQLCCVSRSLKAIASQLLYSRGLAYKRWSRGVAPRCWQVKRKVDWGLTTSLTEGVEWELRPDKPHISHHLKVCPYNVRVEHSTHLANVFGRPVIDPTMMLRNFGY